MFQALVSSIVNLVSLLFSKFEIEMEYDKIKRDIARIERVTRVSLISLREI